MSLQETIFSLFVLLSSLGQTYAQTPAAILLNEDGSFRCRIENNESKYLSPERLGNFVLSNPEAEQYADELNALEVCDRGDQIYALSVFDSQEISMAGMPSIKHPILKAALGAVWVFGWTIYAYKKVDERENEIRDIVYSSWTNPSLNLRLIAESTGQSVETVDIVIKFLERSPWSSSAIAREVGLSPGKVREISEEYEKQIK